MFANQSQIFSNQVLPSLFHGTPAQFLQYLDRDGTKFLMFYWKIAGEKCATSMRRDSFGLNFSFHEPSPGTLITIIRLPEPVTEYDCYFSALIYRPSRRIFFVSDTTKVINLEKCSRSDFDTGTLMVEWNRHLRRETINISPRPIQEEFFKILIQVLRELP